MKLRHLELINAILQTGTLSAAARLLGITQPAATRTLQHAESALGYALFTRREGRLHATEEMKHLGPLVRQAFDGFADASSAASNLRGRSQPTLRVGIVLSVAGPLPQAYQRMSARHGDMRCEFSSGHYSTLLHWLLLHEIDIGIALEPPPHAAIAMQVLGTRRLVCAARPDQLGRYHGAAAIPAEGLKSMSLIEVINTDPVGSMVARYADRFEWPYPARLAVATHQIALDLAASGLGVAVVDDLSAARYAAELEILPIEPAASLSLVAMSLKTRALPVAAARFITAYTEAVDALDQSRRRMPAAPAAPTAAAAPAAPTAAAAPAAPAAR